MRTLIGLLLVAGCTSSTMATGPSGDDDDDDTPVGGQDAGGTPKADASQAPADARAEAPKAEKIDPFSDANPGALTMYEYAPADMPVTAPVVVVLHGCTQTAADYARAGWNELADAAKFYVVYAEQTAANNSGLCFNWFESGDSARTGGEAESIKRMVDSTKSRHGVDDSRVFVTGLSAGGAMTAVMLAAYPDVFAAGAIMAGVPYRCATSAASTPNCAGGASSNTPARWGDLVRNESSAFAAGGYPRVSIWQGTADQTVSPLSAKDLLAQWCNVQGIPASPTSTEAPAANATHDRYAAADGTVLVESWTIEGMGHGTAIDPAHGCGTAGPFILDEGLCSTSKAAEFFGLL